MRKIVIVINQLAIGGAERVAVDEVNELSRRGIPLVLITLKFEKAASYMSECRIPDSDRICIPFTSVYDIGAWLRFIRALRNLQPLVAVTHLWFANTIGRIGARCARVPYVISFEHNVYDEVKTVNQFLMDRLLQSWSTHIVAVSEAVRASIVQHGIRPSRIVVIENGINLSRYTEAKPVPIRQEHRLGDDILFLFVGRLVHQKGVDVLLQAFANVRRGYLLIVGAGPDRERLQMLAENLAVSDRVFFYGVRLDVPGIMKAADCLVLPSRWEGQGLVLPEAFAAGLPVVISDFPAGRSLVQNGVNGFVVPRENAEDLSRAMQMLADSAETRHTLAAGARETAAHFSIRRHVDTLLSYVG